MCVLSVEWRNAQSHAMRSGQRSQGFMQGCAARKTTFAKEYWSIMHSSWIFSIDNEWIFVVIIKTGPDFGKRILRPQLFSRRPLKDPGFWILDSETFLVLQSTGFVILDSGFSGGKSQLSSFELKSQLSPCTQLEQMYDPPPSGISGHRFHPIPDTARRRHGHHRIRDLPISGYRPIGNDLTRKSARGQSKTRLCWRVRPARPALPSVHP